MIFSICLPVIFSMSAGPIYVTVVLYFFPFLYISKIRNNITVAIIDMTENRVSSESTQENSQNGTVCPFPESRNDTGNPRDNFVLQNGVGQKFPWTKDVQAEGFEVKITNEFKFHNNEIKVNI